MLLISVNVASLENVFLLTNAVLYAGCDMIVIEKVSRGKYIFIFNMYHRGLIYFFLGLKSIGVPMTATLIAELIILSLGGYMENTLIKEFCMFTKVALCVDYILEMTFVIAVLSIDIKRVEVNHKTTLFFYCIDTILFIFSWLILMIVKCQKDYMN